MKRLISDIFSSWGNTCITLFKILVPVSILVRVLQVTGWLHGIGIVFEPVMQIMGLPGEMSIAWVSAMFGNIYGGLLAFYSIQDSLQLTVAQVTVTGTIILLAHNFLLEVAVVRKAGLKTWYAVAVRFGTAMLLGALMNIIYSSTGWLQEPAEFYFKLDTLENPSWGAWALNELKNYFVISMIILALISLLEILKKAGLIDRLNRLLEPALKAMGMSPKIVPVTLIGLTLGLGYGGALIISEAKQQHFSRQDLLYSLTLMSLFHSIIEDTLLILSVGADWSGVILFRLLAATVLTCLLIKTTKHWPDDKLDRYFVVRKSFGN